MPRPTPGPHPRPAPARVISWSALLVGVCTAAAGLSTAASGDVAGDLAAARQLQSAGRWPASESLATAVLGRLGAERAPDSLAIADAMELVVRSKINLQAFRDTLAPVYAGRVLGIRMRRLGADDARVADAHHELAFVLGTAGKVDSAYHHAARGYEIRIRAPAPDDTLIAESLRLLGLVSRDRSDFRAASDYFRRAYEQRLRAHDENRQVMVRLLAERGNALRRSGELEQAREVLLHAIEVCDRALGTESFERTVPLDYLALVERESGNLAGSLERSHEAVRLARLYYPDDHMNVVRLRRNASPVLIEIGDFAAASALMEAVVPAYEKTFGRDHPRTLAARLSLGSSRVGAGDSSGAVRELEAVIAAFSARPGPPDPLIATSYVWLGELHASRDNHALARDLFRRAIPLARAARVPQWLTLAELNVGLVQARVALGDTAGLESDRLEMMRIAAQRAVENSNIPQTLRRTNAMALRALGRTDEAWTEALEADRIARRRLQANVRSLPDRRALQMSLQYSPTTDLVVDMARTGDGVRAAAAWDALVHSRGLVRAEMANRRLPHDARGDSALAGAHGRWIAAQRRHAMRLVAAAEDAEAAGGGETERLRAAAEAAERDFAAALAARGRAADRPEVGLADVLARLLPGQALVGFIETQATLPAARVTAFVARGGSDRIARVELGPSAALRAAIEPWRERLGTSPGTAAARAGPAERACRRAGQAVRALLWEPLAPHLAGAREVLVVPDGALVGLSWQALPEGQDGYLVERGPTVLLLNAERELVDAPRPAGSGSLLALGAPDFGPVAGAKARSATRLPTAADPCAGGLPEFGPLPATASEVEAVAQSWIGARDVITGAGATEAAFKQSAAGREVLHLATHGVVARDTCVSNTPGLRGVGGVEPLPVRPGTPRAKSAAAPAPAAKAPSPWLGRRVWLALADANRAASHTGDENEGLLTAEEVLTLDLEGAEWVVLSACHSALAQEWSREGALGMRRAFHLAGARAVIASQWSVEDEATREWMQALYAARAAGRHDAGPAVAEASRAVLAKRRAQRRTTHPFYWAAFDATGR